MRFTTILRKQGCSGRSGLLGEHVGEPVRIDRFCRDDDIDGFAQAADLAIGHFKMAEELLLHILAGNSGFVIDVIFGKSLVGRCDMDLHVLESEPRIERSVQEGQEFADFRWPLQNRRQSDGRKIGKL